MPKDVWIEPANSAGSEQQGVWSYEEVVPLSWALFLVLSACTSENGTTEVDQHPDNNRSYECLGTSFRATAENNYSTWSKMTLPVIKVEPMTELSFDWGSVTKDFITHDLDPKVGLD
jgi:hypothetical protein